MYEFNALKEVFTLPVYVARVLSFVFWDEVKEFRDAVLTPTAVNFVSTDAVYVASVKSLVTCDAVNVLVLAVNALKDDVVTKLFTVTDIVAIPALRTAVILEPLKFNWVELPNRTPSSDIGNETDAVTPVNLLPSPQMQMQIQMMMQR